MPSTERLFRPADNAAIDQIHQTYSPISDLDLMIQNGWGETPQYRLPKDWRTRRNPHPRVILGTTRDNET
jgi:hypothetical protein